MYCKCISSTYDSVCSRDVNTILLSCPFSFSKQILCDAISCTYFFIYILVKYRNELTGNQNEANRRTTSHWRNNKGHLCPMLIVMQSLPGIPTPTEGVFPRKDVENWCHILIPQQTSFKFQFHSSPNHTAICMRRSCGKSLPVKFSEAARSEISLQRWYASGSSIRGALLANETSVNG